MRWARRIFRMVEAATRCPSRHSSPWILTTPHRAFSQAKRTISATSSSGTGGRPGALAWRHLAATRRRCQRSSVPGVMIRRARSPLGMILASAARTARSVQDIRGLGFARRSTATSCRSASISTSLRTRTGPAAPTRTARSPAAGKPARQTWVPIVPTPEPQVKPSSRVFDHYRDARPRPRQEAPMSALSADWPRAVFRQVRVPLPPADVTPVRPEHPGPPVLAARRGP